MLPELLICVAMLAIAIAALMGAFLGQLMLNEHARNLTWAIHDANRVMERLRQANTNCQTPSAAVLPVSASNFTSWNAWLASTAADGGGGKSIQPFSGAAPDATERVVVTCQDQDGGTASTDFCGKGAPAQVGTGEWNKHQAGGTSFDPIRVTVTVCWRHRQRVIGECRWDAGTNTLIGDQTSEDNVSVPGDLDEGIESPATLVTLMTCRR